MVRVSIKKRGSIYHAKVQDGFATVRFTLKDWDHVKELIRKIKVLSVSNMYLPPYLFSEVVIAYRYCEVIEQSVYGAIGGGA